MIQRVVIIGLICLISIPAIGQSSISGKVKSSENLSIAFANILLLNMADSSFVKGTITTSEGNFLFENINSNKYYISVSMVGYKSFSSNLIDLKSNEDVQLPIITLEEGVQLDEVVVKAEVPIYTQKIDRMIINVESSILSSGSSAIEILERSPGVIINRQNNEISVIGKTGVVVLINGRNSNLPQSSIIQLLEGMGSDNIESIELITTPPANFDSEGNAGFINIVLKDDPDFGLNGSYSLSGGYGKGMNTSNNISFNYRFSKFNLFGNYSFLRNAQEQIITFRRSSLFQENEFNTLNTVSTRDPIRRNHNFRLGFDYEISSKTVLGILYNGFNNKWTMNAINESITQPSSIFTQLINNELNLWRHQSGNINLKHDFNQKNSLSIDFDYLKYDNENPTNYVNTVYGIGGLFIEREEEIQSDKDTPINFFIAKADFSSTLSEKLSMEVGIKGVLSDFENSVSVSNLVNGLFEVDSSLTSLSDLNEKIYAAYTSFDLKFGDRTSAKTGLRYEHTDTKVIEDNTSLIVNRNFGTFFPSAFVSHVINDSLNLNLAYSKRIRRPTINNLAPYVIFIDPSSFITGNPSLKPSVSNSIKFDLNYKKYQISLQYGVINDNITGNQPRLEVETDRLLFESVNIDKTKIFSMSLGLPFRFTNWWNIQNNIVFVNTKIENNINNLDLEFNQNTFRIFNNQTFRVFDWLSSELNVNYYGPNIFGSTKTEATYSMSTGLQFDLGKTWGKLRFNINDIWDSLEFTNNTIIPEQNISVRNTYNMSNRTFLLTYSRTFGNKKLRASRNRKGSADDVRSRVN